MNITREAMNKIEFGIMAIQKAPEVICKNCNLELMKGYRSKDKVVYYKPCWKCGFVLDEVSEHGKFNKRITMNQVAPLKSEVKRLKEIVIRQNHKIKMLMMKIQNRQHEIDLLKRDVLEKEGRK